MSETEIDEASFTERFLATLEGVDAIGKDLLVRHAWRVRQKNSVMNLTRIVEPEAMAVKHVMDSLAARPILAGTEDAAFKRVLDVGTGAGYPGLALAITMPELHVTLLDSTRKKIDFLEGVVAELGLASRVDCAWGRFDEWIRPRRHDFDIVLARAVGPLPRLLEWCTNRWFGHLLLWKGPGFDEELAAARELLEHRRMFVALDQSYRLDDDVQRRLVVIA